MPKAKQYWIEGRDWTIRQISEESGLSPNTIHQRIKYGWTGERLLDGPAHKRKLLIEMEKAGAFEVIIKTPVVEEPLPKGGESPNPWAVAAAILHERLAIQGKNAKLREREERREIQKIYNRRMIKHG